MTLFSYKALKKSGESYTATVTAEDKYTLAHNLKEKGETLITVEEVTTGRFKDSIKRINELLGGVRLREKIMFARNLSAMIAAGLSVSRGLSVLERQTKNIAFKKVITDVNGQIEKGKQLSEALSTVPKVFSPLFVSMIRAGEESGHLSEALENLAVQLDKSYQLKRRIRGAMMYPSIVIGAMIIVGILMLIFVVPTLTSTFTELNVELPTSTQLIIGISTALKEHTIISLSILAACIIFFVTLLRHKKTKPFFEFVFLSLPVIGNLIQETNTARTARTLSSLLVSGVEVVSALGVTRDVLQNTHYKKVIGQAEVHIQKGAPLSKVFGEHKDLYPVFVSEMMSVGEEAGDLPKMLNRIAVFYEGEVDQKTKDISTIIEPILMIIIGGVVGFFAVSMITPIYSLSSAL